MCRCSEFRTAPSSVTYLSRSHPFDAVSLSHVTGIPVAWPLYRLTVPPFPTG
jgi:hypothetical protein